MKIEARTTLHRRALDELSALQARMDRRQGGREAADVIKELLVELDRLHAENKELRRRPRLASPRLTINFPSGRAVCS